VTRTSAPLPRQHGSEGSLPGSGGHAAFNGNEQYFRIDSAYASNTPIFSSAIFNNSSLVALGFTTTGLIGTWTLDNAT
jgi:hypothetical protein